MTRLPDEIDQLRSAAQRVVTHLLLLEPEFHRTGIVPAEVGCTFAELGYFGMRLPATYGGSELGMLATVVVVQELGRLPPQFWPFLRVALGPSTKALVRHGTETQKQRWLPSIGAGQCGVAFVLTEPDAGSDLSAMRTRAKRSGDGYLISGSKTYISNADRADLFVVFARTNPEARLKGAISAFLVERGAAGMTIGPPMPTMGTTLTGLFEVQFDECRVPASSLLGEEGRGFEYAMESLNEGRLNVGAIALGMAGLAFDLAQQHTKTRVAFGQPIASNQVVQHMLVDASMELHAGRLMLLDAAQAIDAGAESGTEAAMAKIFCSEAAGRIIDTAVQLFGAAGYCRGSPIERLYRDVRVLRIYEGASEILRNTVARKILS